MWAILWPFFLAAWMFLFAAFLTNFFGRKGALIHFATDRFRWQPVQQGLRWVFYLSVGYGSLIVVASLPMWFHWGQLHVRGVPVSATVLDRRPTPPVSTRRRVAR